MARPLRIEFSGALYHVTARGNARGAIYDAAEDRREFLALLAGAVERHEWYCHAYCLMDNHYHLLIETGTASLSKGMKYLNGRYTQWYNRRYARVGHLFQGRFKAILVQKDAYLLELARYIVLNPVRARMVRSAREWPWSSYRATAGFAQAEACLTTDWILGAFAKTKQVAWRRYREFIREGKGQPTPWEQLKNQIYLGDERFVEDMQRKIDPGQSLEDIPSKHKRAPPRPLGYYERKYRERDEAMAQAYLSGHYTLSQVGEHFGVSYATVSRSVAKQESKRNVKCKA